MRSLLLVDDHAGFRAFAKALLDGDRFRVIGEAPDGAAALDLAALLRPDVVLVDVGLPDVDGFGVARALAEMVPAPAVVLISSRNPTAFSRRLETTSARGFMPKAGLDARALDDMVD